MSMCNPLLMLLQSLPFQLPTTTHIHSEAPDTSFLAAVYPNRNCYFCGGATHNRLKCPARESVCHNYEIKGHFSRVCRSKKKPGNTSGNVATMYAPTFCAFGITAAFPNSLSHVALPAVIDGVTLTALIGSCSSDSFINQQVANRLQLTISPTTRNIYDTYNTENRCHLVQYY